ncbi:MAG: exodeoxyribonuclease III [Pseudomonadota bacterium]
MKIATWNVNSVNARLPGVLQWFDEAAPDVACLQEIKCVDEKFPADAFEDRGYNVIVHGQKTYNGVALLSKHPVEDVVKGLPGDASDDQARYVEALIAPDEAAPVRIAALYLPNGNPAPGPKYDYKLKWMARLKKRAEKLLAQEEAFILAGDYNVIPADDDVHDPDAWRDDALFRPQTHAAFRTLLNLGLTEAFRAIDPTPHAYSYWDYKAGAWNKDNGIRIDHLLASPQAADRLGTVGIDKHVRGREKPSDHVPVWTEISCS